MKISLKIPTTLAGRYKLFSTLTTLLLLTISFVTYNNITKSISEGYKTSKQRIEVYNTINSVNKEIYITNRLLDIYLINPQTKAREEFFEHIMNSVATLSRLSENEWIKQDKRLNDVFSLMHNLLELSYQAERLMYIRLTPTEMYPSMGIANNKLFQHVYKFDDNMNQILTELQDAGTVDFGVYGKFVELRDKHRRLIMAFRMYMINRIGSNFEDKLDAQSLDIELYGNDIYESLTNDFNEHLKNPDMEFIIGEPIKNLKTATKDWLASFKEIKEINASDKWRSDLPIIISKINPMVTKIHEILDQFELDLQQSMSAELTAQYKTNKSTALNLLILTGLFILISIAVYMALYYALLKPISSLSKALQKNIKPNYQALVPAFDNDEMRQFLKSMEIMHDQALKREEHLEYTACHDSLTQLPNRLLLLRRITSAIQHSKQNNSHFALAMLDLDRFKEINDTLGHGAGDKVICEVAHRIKKCLYSSDIVARLGGDEFAILLNNIKERPFENTINRISKSIAKPINVQGQNLHVGSSIGVAICPVHGETDEVLMKNADIAMYYSKKSNLDYAVYNQRLDENNLKTLTLHSDLYNAINKSELFMVYQPVYNIKDKSIYGFEALLRWRHPIFGIIEPDEFIPHAEHTGLITKLTPWILQESLNTLAQLHMIDNRLCMGINITALDLQNDSIVGLFDKLCSDYNLPPQKILLDLTERSLMTHNTHVHKIVNQLNAAGIQIAIDDFGTGFSSLEYLSLLPINMLKIDKSFIKDIHNNSDSKLVVQSIIDIAKNFKLKSLAKGVLNDFTVAELSSLHCDFIQGDMLSKPLTYEQCLALISPDNVTKLRN